MNKPNLAEIRIDVAQRRERIKETPHYKLPDNLVQQLLKQYKKRAEKLLDVVGNYFDEPNKRMFYEGKLDKVESVIFALENPVLAKGN